MRGHRRQGRVGVAAATLSAVFAVTAGCGVLVGIEPFVRAPEDASTGGLVDQASGDAGVSSEAGGVDATIVLPDGAVALPDGAPLPVAAAGTVLITALRPVDMSGVGTVLPAGRVEAFFTPDGKSPRCTETTDGPCRILKCNPKATATALSAGVVGVSGASVPASLPPLPDNTYATFVADPKATAEAFFAAGATLHVTAVGATVPAFSGSVVAGRDLGPFVQGGGFTVELGRYIWSGSPPTETVLAQLSAPDGSVRISCTATGASQLLVPPTALAQLPAGTAVEQLVGVLTTTTVVAGGTAVQLQAFLAAGSGLQR